jgi:hypothetical protein
VEGQSPILEKMNDPKTHLIHQFVLVILLVKVNKSYFVLEGKNVTSHQQGGGEGVREMSPNVTRGEGGSKKCAKKCHILFEWPQR